MLAQRLRRWFSPALVQCLVLAGVLLDDVIIFSHFNKSFHQRPWMGFGQILSLAQYRANVGNIRPPLTQTGNYCESSTLLRKQTFSLR